MRLVGKSFPKDNLGGKTILSNIDFQKTIDIDSASKPFNRANILLAKSFPKGPILSNINSARKRFKCANIEAETSAQHKKGSISSTRSTTASDTESDSSKHARLRSYSNDATSTGSTIAVRRHLKNCRSTDGVLLSKIDERIEHESDSKVVGKNKEFRQRNEILLDNRGSCQPRMRVSGKNNTEASQKRFVLQQWIVKTNKTKKLYPSLLNSISKIAGEYNEAERRLCFAKK